MLNWNWNWTLFFLIAGIVAAILAFGGMVPRMAENAKIVFYVFLALFIASLVVGGRRRGLIE